MSETEGNSLDRLLEGLLRALDARRSSSSSSSTASAGQDDVISHGAPGVATPAALLRDPPLFDTKVSLTTFLAWKDKFVQFCRRGGRTSAESAVATSNAATLQVYWYAAAQALTDLPSYGEARTSCASDLSLDSQLHWLQLLEQVIRYNISDETPVRPKFDTFALKWVDASNIDVEELASIIVIPLCLSDITALSNFFSVA